MQSAEGRKAQPSQILFGNRVPTKLGGEEEEQGNAMAEIQFPSLSQKDKEKQFHQPFNPCHPEIHLRNEGVCAWRVTKSKLMSRHSAYKWFHSCFCNANNNIKQLDQHLYMTKLYNSSTYMENMNASAQAPFSIMPSNFLNISSSQYLKARKGFFLIKSMQFILYFHFLSLLRVSDTFVPQKSFISETVADDIQLFDLTRACSQHRSSLDGSHHKAYTDSITQYMGCQKGPSLHINRGRPGTKTLSTSYHAYYIYLVIIW